MENNYVVGIGAANVDINGKSKKALIMQDSNPGYMNISIGGVTRNVLENLARLDLPVHLIASIGKDAFGDMIVSHCAKCKIDLSYSLRVEGESSSTYLDILDDHGSMQLALSDMHIIDYMTVEEIEKRDEVIRKAKVITFDPCLREDTICYLTETYRDKVIFCDPVSSAYALRVRPYISHIHTMKPNRMELAILAEHPADTMEEIEQACQILIDKGVRRVFVSLGRKGLYYYDAKGNRCLKSMEPLGDYVSASGAGDSSMSGIIYGYFKGLNLETTMDYALACGKLALLSKSANNPELSVIKVEEIIERERKK